jgi:hypothetical protein
MFDTTKAVALMTPSWRTSEAACVEVGEAIARYYRANGKLACYLRLLMYAMRSAI